MMLQPEPTLSIEDLLREALHRGMFPWSKSWLIRLGLLDILHGRRQIEEFLASQPDLSDDLKALARVAQDWRTRHPLRVGESGTIYRYTMYAAEKLGDARIFEPDGSLVNREISKDTAAIVRESQRELLRRDGGTTQWASAAVLLGDPERLPDAEPELRMSYDAYAYWMEQCHAHELDWEPRLDLTIIRQARVFLELLAYRERPREVRHDPDYTPPPQPRPLVAVPAERPRFKPIISEDFALAVALDEMTVEEGARRWPKLSQHESNRLREMPRLLKLMRSYDGSQKIDAPPDHRLVMAIAMRANYDGPSLGPKDFTNPGCVSKSWPRFWDFVRFAIDRVIPKKKPFVAPR
jgi:hypothetical protein